MNIEEFKDLKIKCVCNNYLILNSTEAGYECYHNSCIYNKSSVSLIAFYEIDDYIEINLFKDFGYDYGIVSANNNHTDVVNDNDIVLSLNEVIKILKLCDMNKYIEKYNNLILFK